MATDWSINLLRDMENKKKHIISSEAAVAIRDKFPKAKHHFLILPWADINNIYELRAEHLPILDEMHLLALKVLEMKQLPLHKFKLGFHAHPHMNRLHLHVISQDFVSKALKRINHWNIFNTKLFVKFDDVYGEIKKNGCFPRFDSHMISELLSSTSLLCNQCDYKTSNLSDLKSHLQKHQE